MASNRGYGRRNTAWAVLFVIAVIWAISSAQAEARRVKSMNRFERAVAMCETRLNYRHRAGSYEGAWGWYHGTWLMDRVSGAPRHAYQATRLQQLLTFRRGMARGRYWGCIANGGYLHHL